MRVDYFHTGGPKAGETIALDRVVNDGDVGWAAARSSSTRPILANTGSRFETSEREPPLYSRGFASVYGEWETTGEQKTAHRTFHESLRFPWPREPVTVTLSKRQPTTASRRSGPPTSIRHRALSSPRRSNSTRVTCGRCSSTGRLRRRSICWSSARDTPPPRCRNSIGDVSGCCRRFSTEEPFKSRRSDFNVRALDLPSAESGINRPNAGVFRRTPLSAEYNIFDSERYVLTLDNRALRDAASAAPYEFIEILVNDKTYGGGGIFNDQATASVDSAFSPYVFVHEFGHHFAALADEYYTSDVAYESGAAEKPEPWEPNITALHDAGTVEMEGSRHAGHSSADAVEQRRVREAHRRASSSAGATFARAMRPKRRWMRSSANSRPGIAKFLSSMTYSGRVGAFEGAGYEARGLYRPEADCIMFTRDPVGFCRVCRRAIDADHRSLLPVGDFESVGKRYSSRSVETIGREDREDRRHQTHQRAHHVVDPLGLQRIEPPAG